MSIPPTMDQCFYPTLQQSDMQNYWLKEINFKWNCGSEFCSLLYLCALIWWIYGYPQSVFPKETC